ncbi:MAG TPA: hypothetical protein PK637_02030 [Flavobacteriales bacterium]|nr:hypothetical protein [Flavobacteriales bacterium]HRE95512.1 hypothetical protein [Flavobacteriales bacterium]HRJ36938.1 hypothetical protein [Flavobacteriales bacterium]HRJ38962.1 hypothetical protein [Flavobacteriales bacterium]
MRSIALLLFLICFALQTNAHAEVPYEFGSSSTLISDAGKNVSNPQHWEETAYELSDPKPLFGLSASSATLTYYNDRLCAIAYEFPGNHFESLRQVLNDEYGDPWSYDSTASGRSGYWNSTEKMVSMSDMGSYVLLTFYDDTQKEFHFGDLMRGSLFWVIVSIVGLFLLYYVVAWLLTSYCEKCKSFGMRYKGVRYDNYTNYARTAGFQILQRSEIHPDTIYIYHCKKCKHIRNDRYSGFWKWWRNNN